ncbi:uncharacterized protein EAE97_009076 [Botrytis byssoidea]|uniref:Uncharacterized protein n=1 Tax=Botrytis byssoidea TaxID=139641 RepID=A0A9P5IB66_9HELO|nr:uncharacterized protein EAE97_009076 [Botrytis byssoidea]KAF7932055.1 hypothetical protein EAE97_009076 [Botrytis byssoidea]
MILWVISYLEVDKRALFLLCKEDWVVIFKELKGILREDLKVTSYDVLRAPLKEPAKHQRSSRRQSRSLTIAARSSQTKRLQRWIPTPAATI